MQQPIRSVAELEEAVSTGRVRSEHEVMMPERWLAGDAGERLQRLLKSLGIAFHGSSRPMAEALVTRAQRPPT